MVREIENKRTIGLLQGHKMRIMLQRENIVHMQSKA